MVARDRSLVSAGRISRPAEVKVWDPVIRVFHWTLVACFFLAWATGDEIQWLHKRIGYIVIALVISRVVWGLVGSRQARLADFVPGPRRFLDYCRDLVSFRAKRHLGHNPAGGAMIVALLLMLAVIGGSGYLMTTDMFWGVGWMESLHETAVNVTVGLVCLHVAGVVITSLCHRENLIRAMITGRKRVETDHGTTVAATD